MYASIILEDFLFDNGLSSSQLKEFEDQGLWSEVTSLSKAIERAFECNKARLERLFQEEQKRPKWKRLSITKWLKRMKT